MHNYIIETERLILRPLKIDDAKAVYQWVSDERVAKYMVYNTYTSLQAVVEWLTTLQEPDEEYHFGFVRIEDGLLIGSGSIGPDSARKDFWGFGYNLRYDCWGSGYATEATKAMMKFANEHFGVVKFSSSHVEQNKASGHVMEKCGLRFVKYGQFQKLDCSNKMRSMEYEGEVNSF
ncbi:MAG: GNAT family N-acetyltransferase [Oscillospiraceae bacterium]|nr:GNAT family N-acetyltransferase [Oscillospiraceae bacterium]